MEGKIKGASSVLQDLEEFLYKKTTKEGTRKQSINFMFHH